MLALAQHHGDTSENLDHVERRMFIRIPSPQTVEGKRLDHTLPALRNPFIKLQLRDLSLGGMSALSDAPIAEGEHLALTFPRRPGRPGWNAYGHVVRCDPSATGYRVAVEFDRLPAA